MPTRSLQRWRTRARVTAGLNYRRLKVKAARACARDLAVTDDYSLKTINPFLTYGNILRTDEDGGFPRAMQRTIPRDDDDESSGSYEQRNATLASCTCSFGDKVSLEKKNTQRFTVSRRAVLIKTATKTKRQSLYLGQWCTAGKLTTERARTSTRRMQIIKYPARTYSLRSIVTE